MKTWGEKSAWRVAMGLAVAMMAVAGAWMGMAGHTAAASGMRTGRAAGAGERAAVPALSEPYVIEYYYKAKWGHAEEFLALFKKNHLPVLRQEIIMGRILKVTMAAPQYHATEDGRWDYRVTITFASAASATDNFDSSTITKQLYPDQETFKKEEQRRFEILEAHWDLPVRDVNLEK
jgi:hypothetical protein